MNVLMRTRQPGWRQLMVTAILLVMLHPGFSYAAKDVACGTKVMIERGDTLSSIAGRCGTSITEILQANAEIRDPDRLTVGTEIKIPDQDVAYALLPSTGSGAPVPEVEIRLHVRLDDSRPGARITLSASDLPPKALVWIKGGWSRAGQLILRRARTDADGMLDAVVRVPRASGPGEHLGNYRFSVKVPRIGRTIWSEPLEMPPSAKETPKVGKRKPRPDPVPERSSQVQKDPPAIS